jgi:hypothetical protein
MAEVDLSTIDPTEELDLGDFGLQPFEGNLLITDAGFEETEAGRRWFIELEPVDNEEAKEYLPGGKLKDGGYLTHADREELVRIGVQSLKRIFRAVFGRESGAIAALKGEMVWGQVSEDDNGFTRVRRLSSAKA